MQVLEKAKKFIETRKAAAVITTLAGVEKVYGEVMSEAALDYLKELKNI
ncbi:DUF1893 domain-containing protein [Halanaerobium congolense]|jgi:hypothetical protein|nr:DUF1893 domain-containing protein [Halanaerobium congolense]SHN19960.1 protein of unknown function [Halanaerobium congolense]